MRCLPFSLVSILLWLLSAGAGAACLEQARDDYERLYCQIRAEGSGAALPNLSDFRRNPPDTRRLLLKRPAERLGLALPERTSGRATPKQEQRETQEKQNSAVDVSETPQAGEGLAGCRLDASAITCGSSVFHLQGNRPNSDLRPGVLEPGNRLVLPLYQGPSDGEEMRHYLLDAYQQYIEKMLSIGLGGSTLSFTKFYYGYQTLGDDKDQFPRRMESMFRFLQQDKASMGVREHYSDERPASLSQCGRLSAQIIVCDQTDINWVYVRTDD